MNTLALDPSLSQTGYAVMKEDEVIAHGTLKSKDNQPEGLRLYGLVEQLKKIIQRFNLHDFAIEAPFVGINPLTAIKLGGVRGVILELAAASHIALYEYTTFEVKKALTNNHSADKEQVNKMVEIITGLETSNYNVSDAVAVGLCHAAKMRFKKAIERCN